MQKSDKRYLFYILLSIAGGAMALTGDVLIGWVVPGSLGKYMMLQSSWSDVAIWRPMLSLIIASAAFPMCLPGLYAVSKRIENTSPRAGRAFYLTSFVSSTGCLLIHAAFCIPQFTYKYIFDAGYPDLAVKLTDKMLEMIVPSVLVASLSMLAAFGILFVVIITGKTVYSRWCVLLNPIVIAPAISIPTYIFTDSVFFSALSMCKMNMGLFLFFIVAAVYELRNVREKQQKNPDFLQRE